MKKIYYLIGFLLIGFSSSASLYTSPGNGVNWTLSDLVTNSGGIVTFNGTEYLFSDSVTISTGDILTIQTDAVVKFNPLVVFKINGTIIIDPPTGVLFSPVDIASPFRGLWLELSTGSIIRKLTYEYASSLRLSDSSPEITDCIFRFNNNSTILATGALSLFRSNPIITNSQFLNNYRAAISGGANIANAPVIMGCTFSGNNTLNGNVPQINLGASGADTIKIIGCTIINPGGIRTGGISIFPLGVVHAFINSNNISGNRYGINLQGGSDVNAMVSYNRIADNNIENNPNLGGSGIAFSGGNAASHQNSIVTGNIIENNLWGITILALSSGVPVSGALPNLGNLNNADTSDDGKNRFINNSNATTPGIDLYNNTSDPIFAMGNYWNTNIESEIETKIFHQADNPAHGLVTFSNFILPIELVSFTAIRNENNVNLQWKTAQEANSHHFQIERSTDGSNFISVGNVAASGNSSIPLTYNYTDVNTNPAGTVYYRLKLVDIDGSFKYSAIVSVTFPSATTKLNRYYPTTVMTGSNIAAEFLSEKAQRLTLQYYDVTGKLILTANKNLVPGFNKLDIPLPSAYKGTVMIKMNAGSFIQTIPVIIQ
jgi:hypothetical protein